MLQRWQGGQSPARRSPRVDFRRARRDAPHLCGNNFHEDLKRWPRNGWALPHHYLEQENSGVPVSKYAAKLFRKLNSVHCASAKACQIIFHRRHSAGISRQMIHKKKEMIMKQDAHNAAVADRPRQERSARQPSDSEKQEMMKKMEEAGRPGIGHKALEPLVGNWKAEVTCWHEPGAAPQVSHGTAKTSWTLNGRFLEEEFRGEMMGKPFEGCYLMGYDNTKQRFQSLWVSDTQTSMFFSEGQGANGNKVITLEGKMNCAATGRKDVVMKTVFRILSQDEHIFEMYDEGNKTMEIRYTRR